MKNMVITIGREYGSGGHEIGARLAKKLGLAFYDKEIIDLSVEKSGCCENYVRNNEEKTPGIFIRSTMFGKGNAYATVTPENELFVHQAEIISELAQKGGCVIVGRCADYVLKDREDVIKFFAHAPLEDRIKRKMALSTNGETEKEIKKQIVSTDKRRSKYYNFYTGAEWGDSRCYDLCIDTSKSGIDGAVDLIIDFIKHYKNTSMMPD